MITFVNDSGVIEVTDASVSPPIIERWLKDMLRIEQYVDIIRFTGTLEDAPGRKEYQLADEATAIAERQTLYEYLEDYGGGGGGSALEILDNGVSVDANVDEINFKTPLKATQTAAGKVDVELDGSAILTGAMYETGRVAALLNITRMAYSPTTDKIYIPSLTSSNVRIYDNSNMELLATITGITSVAGCSYIPFLNEVWAAGTSGSITRINVTTNAVIGTIATGANSINKFIEYTPTIGNTKAYGIVQSNSASPTGSNILAIDLVTFTITNIALTTGGTSIDGVINMNSSSAMFRHLVITVFGTGAGLYILNCETDTLVASSYNPATFSANIRGIAYVPTNDKYYVCDYDGNALVRLEPTSASTMSLNYKNLNLLLPSGIEYDSTNQVLLVNEINASNVGVCYKADALTGFPIAILNTNAIRAGGATMSFSAILNNNIVLYSVRSSSASLVVKIKYA
jgi:hypothetical protein